MKLPRRKIKKEKVKGIVPDQPITKIEIRTPLWPFERSILIWKAVLFSFFFDLFFLYRPETLSQEQTIFSFITIQLVALVFLSFFRKDIVDELLNVRFKRDQLIVKAGYWAIAPLVAIILISMLVDAIQHGGGRWLSSVLAFLVMLIFGARQMFSSANQIMDYTRRAIRNHFYLIPELALIMLIGEVLPVIFARLLSISYAFTVGPKNQDLYLSVLPLIILIALSLKPKFQNIYSKCQNCGHLTLRPLTKLPRCPSCSRKTFSLEISLPVTDFNSLESNTKHI